MTNTHSFPLISIVLPTYNRASYIMETIKSVREQTYPNWELLIIDEGSSDDTEDLISGINDERIKFHKVRARINLTATRGEGVAKAKGEFIGFIDSDDLWDAGKLEKQMTAFYQYPEAGFCLTGAYNFKKPNEPLVYFYKQREGLRYDFLITAFYKSQLAALTPTLLFRRKCLETVEFTNHVEFIMLLACHFRGIILYEPLLFRRLHDSNTSSDLWKDRDEYGINLLIKYKRSVPADVARNAIANAYISSGENFLLHKQNREGIRSFLKAFLYKPFNIVPIKKIVKAVLYSFK